MKIDVWINSCLMLTSPAALFNQVSQRLVQALFITLVALSSLHPQKKLLFEHLTGKQGLSQSSVMCILQDRRGFIWLGTQDGLNRFDGYELKIFKHEAGNRQSLSENFIVLLAEDGNGAFWVGTLENPNVLNRYDPMSETFSLHPRDSVNLSGASISAAFTTYEEDTGIRWSGKIRGGVTRLDPKTGAKKFFRHNPSDPKSLIDDNVYSVYGDRQGTIWIGTREGLDRFDPKTETFVHYRHDEKNPSSLSDNWVWPIFEDRSGALWIGTMRGGLNRFDRQSGLFTCFKTDPADPRSLSDNRLYSIYQDQSGLIWVGTGEHGVDRFRPEGAPFDHLVQEVGNPNSLIDNSINGIIVDRSGGVWIGTAGGLEKYDRTTGKIVHYQHKEGDQRSIADNRVQTLLEDKAGDLWIGFFSAGLDRLNRKTGSFTHYKHDPSNAKGLSDNRIYALLEDRDGSLWVGTYGGGLNRLERKTSKVTLYAHHDSLPSSLGANGVWALFEDRDGALWVGTYGGGLDKMNKSSGTFEHFVHKESDLSSLSNDNVTCIYEDRKGNLWVGTIAGLNKMDRASGTFRQYKEKDGLPNEMILGILEDGKGNLWLSTNKGISKFNSDAGTFRNFSYSDGLQGDEFNQNAYARSPVTGEIYFGGANGFNVFHPDNVKDNLYVPPVVFSSFVRYNTDDAEGKPIEEKGIAAKNLIVLSHKDNVATFQFAALNYYNPGKNLYAYKLEGYGTSWIQLGRDRRATFTNLDGGEYTLRVRGSNNDGVWNEEGVSMTVIVNPPWWKTRGAYAGYIVIVVSILYGIRRFENNQKEQKARMREAQLHAKAVEAEKRALEAENERKTKELEDARLLQLSLLPKDLPALPDYDIAVYMKTSTEVGGDYYDFSVDSQKNLDIAFGDATGHGMQAGTIVTLMKGLFISESLRFDIRGFFNQCSRAIKDIRLGRLFMAFTLVRLKGNSVSFSSAGMPPVFFYRARDGSIEEVLVKGMPLGAMKNFPYALHETHLDPGDTLLLLTDGLPEQKNANGEMFDYARVQELLAKVATDPPNDIIASLATAGDEWMNGATQDDDITMMVIKMK